MGPRASSTQSNTAPSAMVALESADAERRLCETKLVSTGEVGWVIRLGPMRYWQHSVGITRYFTETLTGPCPSSARTVEPRMAHGLTSLWPPGFFASAGPRFSFAGRTCPAQRLPFTAFSFPRFYFCRRRFLIAVRRASALGRSPSSPPEAFSLRWISLSTTRRSCARPPPTPPCLATTRRFSSVCLPGWFFAAGLRPLSGSGWFSPSPAHSRSSGPTWLAM